MDASAFDRAGCEPGNDPFLEDHVLLSDPVSGIRLEILSPRRLSVRA